ncbi:MAG: hypothetical protein H0W68_11795 [Gemmatimonadaceae bacterium]|nr:hypothetical protein [Gemmatimonadaceae bacterium]
MEDLRPKEDRLALALGLVIGALVGLVVVAFIVLTGRLASHVPRGVGSVEFVMLLLWLRARFYLLPRNFARASGLAGPRCPPR